MGVNAKMTAIADEIRAKTGGTDALTLDDMVIEVPKVYDAGYQKGRFDAPQPNIQPLNVTENGTYEVSGDIDGFSPVTVAVESEVIEPTIEPLTITENGTYTAPEGIDGYSPITVEVEGEGGSLIDPSWTDLSYLLSGGRATDEIVSKLKFSDTSSCTNFGSMFYKGTMTNVPLIDTSKGTLFSSMFSYCTQITTIPAIDTSQGTNMSSMFSTCGNLLSVPPLNTSNCTNFASTFQSCTKLETISQIDMSKTTTTSGTFGGCTNLKNITFVGTIPMSISFSNSLLLTIDSLKSIITALVDYAGTTNEGKYKLTLHATSKTNLEAEGATAPNGLTWIAFAESKGWNIA